MDRAYTLLEIKSIDDDDRVIEGIATTPTPDRQGDVMEPKGAQYALPMPFLWHHGRREPIGEVFSAIPTKDGIAIKARVSRVDAPGPVRDRVEEAWHSFKAKPPLVRGLSIDWAPKEFERIPGTDYIRHTKWVWAGLSAVTMPANVDATIIRVKQFDMAASGLHLPGVTGAINTDLQVARAMRWPVVHAVKAAPSTMTTTEQITAFENTRAAKAARMNELMSKAAEAGVTLDEAQTEEYDTTAREVASVDAHLVRLRAHEKTMQLTATPITPTTTTVAASAMRGGQTSTSPVIQVKSNLPKGTAFTRYVMAKIAGKGSLSDALNHAKQWQDSTPEVELMLKAAVNPGTIAEPARAAPLAVQQPFNDFLELLRPETLLGKIPGLKRVPFNISIPVQTGGGTYAWVGEGDPKPVGNLQFSSVNLGVAKAAGIIVISEELAKISPPRMTTCSPGHKRGTLTTRGGVAASVVIASPP